LLSAECAVSSSLPRLAPGGVELAQAWPARLDADAGAPVPAPKAEAAPEFGPALTGAASFYHPSLNGLPTASGETYSDHALTAASLTLKLGTRVRVTNLENQRNVVVTINDRGPYVHGRIIDLSRRAASALGFVERGITKVRVQPL
jgi:rare lipoprotein A (peptidoglycan hydrolase)